MSSLFDLEDRVRRLRETLAYLKQATLTSGDELRAMAPANRDVAASAQWRFLLAELREFASMAEGLGSSSDKPGRRPRRATRPKMAANRESAIYAGATVH